MIVVFDTTILSLLINPNQNVSFTENTKMEVDVRINLLIKNLEDDKAKIIIPTPALAEMLIKYHYDPDVLIKDIQKQKVFRIVNFDTLAAIELAAMTKQAISSGDKRDGNRQTWSKIKFDRQIIAIAKVQNASVIYSDDEGVQDFGQKQGLKVIGVNDLPLPETESQHKLDLPVPEAESAIESA